MSAKGDGSVAHGHSRVTRCPAGYRLEAYSTLTLRYSLPPRVIAIEVGGRKPSGSLPETGRRGAVCHARSGGRRESLSTNPDLTREWLQNALSYLPDHPLLHLASARFESDAKRADFLCGFGLARLSRAIALRRRAAELLFDQHRLEVALSIVDDVLRADPGGCVGPASSPESPGSDVPKMSSLAIR
jgi:hypothetical protein